MVLIINKKTKKAEIDAFLKKAEQRTSKNNGFDADKYFGKIKLKEHPLEIQKRLRDEWS